MGCGSSTQKDGAEKKLSLPQHDSDELREKRDKQVKDEGKRYALIQHPNRDLPPWVKDVPVSEEVSASGVWVLTKVFYRLVDEKIKARMELLGNRITNSASVKEPFGRFRAVFDDDEVPTVAKVWRSDEEFGYSRLNGLMPQFVQKISAVPDNFKVKDSDVEGLLPKGKTLAALAGEGRLFLSDVCQSLAGVQPVRDNVMCVPMALYIIDDEKKFMPIAITLSRDGGAVFTPKDAPGLWLAAKTHLSCAEFQVHTLLIHALSEHLMMEPLWACMCQAMSQRHPLHAFIEPHMWNMVFVNAGVRDSILADKDFSGAKGSLQDNLQAGKDGSVQILKNLYTDLTWKDYFDIPVLYKKLGIMDIPNYFFRDDSLALWQAILQYSLDFVKAAYPGGAKDIAADYELQNFAKLAADPNVGDIRGLPVGPSGRFESEDQIALLLTMVIYQCAVRHSHVENAAVNYYPWVPAYPASYRLPIPTTRDDIPLEALDAALPDNDRLIAQIALIESVNLNPSEVHPLLKFPQGFLENAPAGCQAANKRFVDALNAIEARIKKELEARSKASPVVCDFLLPTKLAASIWN